MTNYDRSQQARATYVASTVEDGARRALFVLRPHTWDMALPEPKRPRCPCCARELVMQIDVAHDDDGHIVGVFGVHVRHTSDEQRHGDYRDTLKQASTTPDNPRQPSKVSSERVYTLSNNDDDETYPSVGALIMDIGRMLQTLWHHKRVWRKPMLRVRVTIYDYDNE